MSNIKSGPFLKTLLVLNALVFVIMLVTQQEENFFRYGGFVPIMITAGNWFALPIPPILTPVSSAFIHSGFMHLAFNMMMLLVCGRAVEAALGWRYCAGLYFAGAYAAAAAQWVWNPTGVGALMPMVGASGAVSAIIGAYAAIFSEQKVKPIGPIPGHYVRILWLAAAWTFIQALFGLAFTGAGQGIIAVAAHIGGFVLGLLLARPLLRRKYGGRAAGMA
jgi:membrane associated rhomboid family serine protease